MNGKNSKISEAGNIDGLHFFGNSSKMAYVIRISLQGHQENSQGLERIVSGALWHHYFQTKDKKQADSTPKHWENM